MFRSLTFEFERLYSSLPPTDEQQDGEAESQTELAPDSSQKQKWTPSPEALDKLLICLASDREEAVKKYATIELKLLRFFEWRGCDTPDSCVDETIDRVMRRIDEGQTITNINGYFYKTAYLIFLEWLREMNKRTALTENMSTTVDPPDFEGNEEDVRLRCFDDCLAELSDENRKLIVGYYEEEKGEKIAHRKKLAADLNIPLNALRIRVHRLRKDLEKCVKDCLVTVPK